MTVQSLSALRIELRLVYSLWRGAGAVGLEPGANNSRNTDNEQGV